MFACMECGHKFRTTKAAERAIMDGCPECGGTDIDLNVETAPAVVRPCPCGSGLESEAEYDGQGIYLCRVCDKCRAEKLSHFRPEILRPYSQEDVDEQIEEDR